MAREAIAGSKYEKTFHLLKRKYIYRYYKVVPAIFILSYLRPSKSVVYSKLGITLYSRYISLEAQRLPDEY